MLISKCSANDSADVFSVEAKDVPVPALAMIVLICVIPCSLHKTAGRSVKVVWAVEGLLKSSGMMINLLPVPSSSAVKSDVEVLAVRMVAMTVVCGRRRRRVVRVRPIPVCWPSDAVCAGWWEGSGF